MTGAAMVLLLALVLRELTARRRRGATPVTFTGRAVVRVLRRGDP